MSPVDVFLAGGNIGKDGGQQIVGANALDLWRDLLPALEAQQRERAVASQRQRVPKMGESSAACSRMSCTVFGCRNSKDIGQREAVLLGERDVDAVVGCGGLQFEVERAAEALAEREAPGFVDAAAEGGVDDELHAAAFVEEALGDDGLFGWGRRPRTVRPGARSR